MCIRDRAYAMFVIYMLPICLVVLFSFCDALAIKTSTLSLGAFTLKNYVALFTKQDAFRPYLVSIVYSVAAAAGACVISVIVARFVRRNEHRTDAFFEYGLLIPWMLPTTFIALGLMFSYDVPRAAVGGKVLIGSIWIMLIAYIVVKLPFSFRMILSLIHIFQHQGAGSGRTWFQAPPGREPADAGCGDSAEDRGHSRQPPQHLRHLCGKPLRHQRGK